MPDTTSPKTIRLYSFRLYLAVLVFLSLVSIFFPSFVYIGFFMGVIPGILLLLSFPVLIYSLLVIGIASLLNGAGNHARIIQRSRRPDANKKIPEHNMLSASSPPIS